MSAWGRVFAVLYEPVLRSSERHGLAELRAGLLAGARGRTLELGAGTGQNLPHYPAAVTQLVLTEPEAAMAARLEARLAASRQIGPRGIAMQEPGGERPAAWAGSADERPAAEGSRAHVVRAGAEALPFADASFDTVVATLVFCTVSDLGRALAEVRRVLAPGGQLLFLEHVRHPDASRARRQRRLTPLQRRLACGCHLDRATPAAIAAAGLKLGPVRSEHFPKAAGFLQPLAVGTATR